MKKTPYIISLVVGLVTLTITIVSISLPRFLRVPGSCGAPNLSYTGLYQHCELRQTTPAPPYEPENPDPTIPPPPKSPSRPPPEPQSVSDLLFYKFIHSEPPITDPSRPDNPKLPPEGKLPQRDEKAIKYTCKPFPSRVACGHDGQSFCVLWSTAGYAMQMSIVFAVLALIILLVVSFRLSTRARRRGAWMIVGALTGVQVALQITAMGIIVHLRRTRPHWFSDNTQYGASFVLLVIAWSMGLFMTVALVVTGFAARAGHKWAAGKRGYHPIPDAS